MRIIGCLFSYDCACVFIRDILFYDYMESYFIYIILFYLNVWMQWFVFSFLRWMCIDENDKYIVYIEICMQEDVCMLYTYLCDIMKIWRKTPRLYRGLKTAPFIFLRVFCESVVASWKSISSFRKSEIVSRESRGRDRKLKTASFVFLHVWCKAEYAPRKIISSCNNFTKDPPESLWMHWGKKILLAIIPPMALGSYKHDFIFAPWFFHNSIRF